MNKILCTSFVLGAFVSYTAQATTLGPAMPKNLSPQIIEARGGHGGGGFHGGGPVAENPHAIEQNNQRTFENSEKSAQTIKNNDQKAMGQQNTNIYNKSNNPNVNVNRNPYWTGYGYDGAPAVGQYCWTDAAGVSHCNY
jgi:hypothetical protein